MKKFFTKKLFRNILIATFVVAMFLPITVTAQGAFVEAVANATVGPNVVLAAKIIAGIGGELFMARIRAAVNEGVNVLVGWLGNLLLTISSFFLWLAGLLLTVVLDETMMKMGTNIDGMRSINVGWAALRDVANLFFIFILLYVAIGSILNISGVQIKKMLVNVVIIALLINFSMFFTKMIIDASNILTISFYNAIQSETKDGISGAIVHKMKLTGIYNPSSQWGVEQGATATLAAQTRAKNNPVDETIRILILSIFGSVFMFIAAFIFLAFSVMFIGRFVILIFLLILSPVAFISMALPEDKYSKKWWNALFAQCIFAPACMALLWVSIKMLEGINFAPQDSSLAGLSSGDPKAVLLVLNFIVIISMLIFTLVVAKEFGAYGANKGMSMLKTAGNKARGVVSGAAKRGAGMAARGALRGVASATGLDKFRDSTKAKSKIWRTILTPVNAVMNAKMPDGQSVDSVKEREEKLNAKHSDAVLEDKKVAAEAEKLANDKKATKDKAAAESEIENLNKEMVGVLEKSPGGAGNINTLHSLKKELEVLGEQYNQSTNEGDKKAIVEQMKAKREKIQDTQKSVDSQTDKIPKAQAIKERLDAVKGEVRGAEKTIGKAIDEYLADALKAEAEKIERAPRILDGVSNWASKKIKPMLEKLKIGRSRTNNVGDVVFNTTGWVRGVLRDAMGLSQHRNNLAKNLRKAAKKQSLEELLKETNKLQKERANAESKPKDSGAGKPTT